MWMRWAVWGRPASYVGADPPCTATAFPFQLTPGASVAVTTVLRSSLPGLEICQRNVRLVSCPTLGGSGPLPMPLSYKTDCISAGWLVMRVMTEPPAIASSAESPEGIFDVESSAVALTKNACVPDAPERRGSSGTANATCPERPGDSCARSGTPDASNTTVCAASLKYPFDTSTRLRSYISPSRRTVSRNPENVYRESLRYA